LINQTLKEIEIILVNDASPDNSMEIVWRYAKQDPRIVVIDSKVNIVASRNLGIKAAKANYLGFVDADDWVEPTMYEELYHATQNETIDVVAADLNDCFSSGRKQYEINIANDAFQSADLVKAYVSQYGGRLFANIWRKELISDDLLFLEQCLYCDSIVFAWYLKANSFAKVDNPLYNYYINDMSVTHKMDNERFFDRLWGAEDMFVRCKNVGLYDIYKDEIDYAFYRLYYRNTIHLIPNNFTYIPSSKVIEIRNNFNRLVDLSKNKYYVIHRKERANNVVRLLDFNSCVGLFYLKSLRNITVIAHKVHIRTRIRSFIVLFSKST
jgi:glycosyltransferase involved in cell wall biosynthesis